MMLPSTEKKIWQTPELLDVALRTSHFRANISSINSHIVAKKILRDLEDLSQRLNEPYYETVARELPGAIHALTSALVDPVDDLAEAQSRARKAGFSERWIRKAMRHPASFPKDSA